MSERFERLVHMSSRLHIEGSPVVIEAAALLKDNENNSVLLQAKIRNISDRNIISCKISVKAFEVNHNEVVGVDEFAYLDINVPRGGEFGSKTPIYLPNNATRSVNFAITEVVFSNNEIWRMPYTQWHSIPLQQNMSSVIRDIESCKQFEIETRIKNGYYPMKIEGLFLCACGAVNKETDGMCYNCGNMISDIIKKVDADYLALQSEQRIKETYEKKEAEELVRRKNRRNIGIVFASIILVASLTCLYIFVGKPYFKELKAYKSAIKMLEAGEYDEAKLAFQHLGDFKDSRDKVLESVQQKTESIYQKAEEAYNNNNYDKAIAIWEEIIDYNDSADMVAQAKNDIIESKYQKALKMMENKKYEDAQLEFCNILYYKDSKQLSKTCENYLNEQKYQEGKKFLKKKEYSKAANNFEFVGCYKDAEELKKKCFYLLGKNEMDAKNYSKAISWFAKSSNYKNGQALRYECVYRCLMEYLNSNDRFDYEMNTYFVELAKANYKDMRELMYQDILNDVNKGMDPFSDYMLVLGEANYKDVRELMYQAVLRDLWEIKTGEYTSASEYVNLLVLYDYKDVKELLGR